MQVPSGHLLIGLEPRHTIAATVAVNQGSVEKAHAAETQHDA
jgi:hypothetical protein